MTEIIPTKFRKSPSFSFRAKVNYDTSFNKPEYMPSPHHYSPQKKVKNQSKVKFGKSQRSSLFDRRFEKSPGPGQYQLSQSKDLTYSSVKSQMKRRTFTERFSLRKQQQPGPGAYDTKIDLKKSQPAYSMGLKFKTLQQIQFNNNTFKPAPGSYQIEPIRMKSSSVMSIPKSPRLRQVKIQTPGPGRYDIDENLFSSQRSFGKKSFCTDKRNISFQIHNQSPGPGKYLSQSDFQISKNKQKGFTCRGRYQAKKQILPGPGQYQSHSKFKFRSLQCGKMSKGEKKLLESFEVMETPGPGNYQNLNQSYEKSNFKSMSAARFSKAKLNALSDIKLKATDKFYDSKINVVRKSSSAFSIGNEKKKSIFQKLSKLPGPGDYNPEDSIIKDKIMSAKFPLSQRHNVVLNKLNVGPGQYHNEQINSSIKKLGAKFSKSKRTTDFSTIQQYNNSSLRMSSHSYINKAILLKN